MAGIMIALSVSDSLFTALNSPLLKEAFLSIAYGNRLKKLKGTVTTVKSVLLDAANKDELSEIDRDYIDKLKEAIYDADDLFDELVTRAERKKLFDDVNIFEKVRRSLPSLKKSLKVTKLRSRLNDIADDHAKFGLSIDTQPHRRVRNETFSNVYKPHVVGRNDDTNKVIGMLLDSGICAYLLAIVGIGGVGKTTLVKRVFNDKRITDKFPIRLWVCVSDQDGAVLDVKQILLNILESLKCKFDANSSVEALQREYQRNLQGKTFLLVLDDIWSEKMLELHNLKELLLIDGSVSRIVATTRSKETARIIGNGTYELKGLSDEHSWDLFQMKAFGDGNKPPEFVEIGKKIVKKSSNVPLSIMVIGTLLYGQPIDKWQTFETSGFNRFSKGLDEIMSILKISYDNLDPSLKSCFAYCAIFPKDYVISKETIINLWEAQGYIVPFEEGQSIENAGEEHFSVLLQRCFFEEVEKDEFGDVVLFKIHDLMHDLAQRISGKEICVINSSMPNLEYCVRHLSIVGSINSSIPNMAYSLCDQSHLIADMTSLSILTHSRLIINTSSNEIDLDIKNKIRSYLMLSTKWHVRLGDGHSTFEMPKNWGCLRALALQTTNVRMPEAIGKLLHLRYLNLSHSKITKLPDSIVKLHNLQTLNINYCVFLEEWPNEFGKLVNLTHLYRDFCSKLRCMPVGMSKLSRMRKLTEFVVADESAGGMQQVGQLKDLKALAMNLKGRISIHFEENFKISGAYDWDGSCLEDAKYLNELTLRFYFTSSLIPTLQDKEKGEMEEAVMEKLKPHPNLRKFILSNYAGEKITRWRRAQDNWATFLPNLVYIMLTHCCRLKELPMFSKLRHLKSLSLIELRNLEYVEEAGTSSSDSRSLDTTFFPSLESLTIHELRNLKRWWKSGDCDETHCQPAFPNLSQLTIRYCPRLILFPPCLSLQKLILTDNNEVLRITTADGVHTSS
ncbi:disease resistance protein RGA2-like [Silene latifolia]|uniref:disease resistance protein RGA2-like n=1 Tax=Silene latifolia TaxID=37657 RepID=UPI003D76DA87